MLRIGHHPAMDWQQICCFMARVQWFVFLFALVLIDKAVCQDIFHLQAPEGIPPSVAIVQTDGLLIRDSQGVET